VEAQEAQGGREGDSSLPIEIHGVELATLTQVYLMDTSAISPETIKLDTLSQGVSNRYNFNGLKT